MEWHVFLRARGHNDSKLLLNPNKIPIDSDKSQGSIAENPLKSAFKPAFLWWKHPTLMVTSPSFPGGVGKTRALEMMTRLLVESDEVLLVMGVPLVIIHFHGMFHCKPSIFGVATFLGNSQYKYCGWLRNPAAPKGWNPVNHGMFTIVFNWCFGFRNHSQYYWRRRWTSKIYPLQDGWGSTMCMMWLKQ